MQCANFAYAEFTSSFGSPLSATGAIFTGAIGATRFGDGGTLANGGDGVFQNLGVPT
jgi:hypothetical protein